METHNKVVVILAVLILVAAFTELAGSAINIGRRAALIKKQNALPCGPVTGKNKKEERGCAHSSCTSWICGTVNQRKRLVKKACKN